VQVIAFVLFPLAHAGIPVVHEEPVTDKVLTEVGAVSGLAAPDFESVLVRNLIRRDPLVLGSGTLTACTKPAGTTLASLRNAYSEAEGDYLYMRDAETDASLRAAEAELACLADPAEGELAARIFLLTAAQALSKKDATAAAAAMRQALSFAPTLTWDARFPAEGQAILDRERKALEKDVRLDVRPYGGDAGPWIDGAAIADGTVLLAPGRHLAQLRTPDGVVSTWIDLREQGASTLVIPSAYRTPVLDGLADPATRPMVETFLRAMLPDVRATYAYYQGGIWLISFAVATPVAPGSMAPELAAIPSKIAASVEPTSSTDATLERERAASPILRWGGASVAVVGGGIATFSYLHARNVRSDACPTIVDGTCTPEDPATIDADRSAYEAARTLTYVGEAVALVGLGAFGFTFLEAGPGVGLTIGVAQ
jgi:hypothetical protein